MATTLDESPTRHAFASEQTPPLLSKLEPDGSWLSPEQLAEPTLATTRGQTSFDVRKALEKAVEHHRKGQLADAARGYRDVIRRDPSSADAWHLIGVIAFAGKKHVEAAAHVDRALQVCPNEAEYHATMAQIQAELSDWERSYTHARNALALNTGCPAALHAMGLVLVHRGDIKSACRHFRDAVVGEPTIGRVWLDYGDCLNQLELYEESLEALQKALELMPESPLPLNSLGSFWRHQGDSELALQSYKEALRFDNELPVAHSNIASLYRELDRTSDAIAHYRRLLKLDDFAFIPAALHSLSELARAGEYEFSDEELDQIEELCLSDVSDRDQSLLHFARARVFEHEELYDDAFEDYALANQYRLSVVRKSGMEFRPEELRGRFDRIIETFTPEFFASARSRGIGNNSTTPVFVIGIPRAGSSVVEQLLTGHPQIDSSGNLTDIDRLAWRMLKPVDRADASPEERYPQWLQSLDSELLSIAAGAYLDHITGIAPNATHIVDRMPGSFLYAGFIALLFPHARIIHCRRNSVDTCLSCFTHSFTDPVMASISGSLNNLRQYSQECERLFDHWNSVLPDSLLTVSYEDLTTEPADQQRRLLEHIGITPADDTPMTATIRDTSVNRSVSFDLENRDF